MRTVRSLLLAGAAAVGLAALPAVADAHGPAEHVMTVRLPDGGVEQIRYTGDVAPAVVFLPDAMPAAFAPPDAMFGRDGPFAMMERISAEMHARMAAMIRQADAMAAAAPAGGASGWTTVAAGDLPPGTSGFSYVATMSGNGVCGRSVRITSDGDGGRPQVLSRTFGDCGAASGPAGASGAVDLAPAPAAHPAGPGTLQVDVHGRPGAIDPALLHHVTARGYE